MPLGIRAKLLLTNKQIKLGLVLTLAISVLISSVSLWMYHDYRSRIDKELNQPIAELLQINMDITNRAFRHFDNAAVQLSFHPWTADYMKASAEDKSAAAARLLTYLQTSVYEEGIHSVYVVDLLNERVLSSAAEHEQAFAEMADQSWIPWALEMSSEPLLIKRRTLGNGLVPSSASAPAASEAISLYRPVRSGDQLVGLIIFNMDYDKLFTSIYPRLNAPLYIYNLDGEMIYPKWNDPKTEAEMRNVTMELNIHSFKEVKLEEQLYLANQAFSDMTGWRWVTLVSLEDLLKNARLVRNLFVTLSLVSILAGCTALYYYGYEAFRPLRRIRELIGQQAEGLDHGDVREVELYLHSLLKEQDLKHAVSKQGLPEIRSKYVEDVLFRRIGAAEMQYKWQRYFQDWSDGPLTAAIVSINRYKAWSAELTEEDQLLLKFALSNLIQEVVDPDWHAINAPLDRENLLLILQPKSPVADAAHSLHAAMDKAIDMSRQYLRMQLSVGLGEPAAAIEELHHSFAAAKAALACRMYEGYGLILNQPSDAPNSGMNEGQTESLLREWQGDVERGDTDALLNRIQEWSQSVKETRPAVESVCAFADQWLQKLLQLCDPRHTQAQELADYTLHELSMMDLEDLTGLMLQASAKVSREWERRLNRREHAAVQQIIGLMQEQMDGNIGLQQIADSIGMSTSSLSSLFRQETGSSVYEYLTRLRIERACRLLSETNRKVADIAPLVGYQNETSFIRSFRRVKGMTPGKYREASKM